MLTKIKDFYKNAYSGHERAWKVFVFGYLIWIVPYSLVFNKANYFNLYI